MYTNFFTQSNLNSNNKILYLLTFFHDITFLPRIENFNIKHKNIPTNVPTLTVSFLNIHSLTSILTKILPIFYFLMQFLILQEFDSLILFHPIEFS